MGNRVQVVIDATDNASAVADRIAGKLQGLAGGLLGSVADLGFGLATQAAQGFMHAVQDAQNSQTDLIKSVGGLAAAIGIPFEKAEELNQNITKGLARYAAALPGSTDDYVKLFRQISDDVATANKDLNNGTFNAQQYTDQVTQLAAKWQALGQGLPQGQVLNPLQKILSGGSLAQLKNLKYFQSNPLLLSNLEKVLNGKTLKELTRGQRLEVALKALDLTLTDDTVKRLGGTLDGQVQGLMTTLFDPTTGVFGLLRDLDENAAGQQTAFQAINEAITGVIGSDGLLFTMAAAFQKMGVQFGDPMVALRNGVQWFTARISELTGWFKQIADGKLSAQAAGNLLMQIPSKLVSKVADFLKTAGSYIGKLDFGPLVNKVMLMFQGVLQRVDTGKLGNAVGVLWGNLFIMIRNSLARVNWGQVAVAIGLVGVKLVQFYVGFFQGLITTVAARFLEAPAILLAGMSAPMQGLGAAIGHALTDAFAGVGQFFSGVWANVISAFPILPALINLFGAIFNLIATVDSTLRPIGTAMIGVFFGSLQYVGSLQSIMSGFFNLLVQAWNGLVTLAQPLMATLSSLIGGFFQSIIERWQALIAFATGLWSSIQNAIASFFNAIASAINNLRSMIPGGATAGTATTGLAQAATATASSTSAVGSRASGFLPSTGMGGLLSAAIRESGKMPGGSDLMVANSSEAVLTRAQQSAIGAALTGRGSSRVFGGQIHIHAAPGMDAQSIASAVMARIEEQFKSYEAGYLT